MSFGQLCISRQMLFLRDLRGWLLLNSVMSVRMILQGLMLFYWEKKDKMALIQSLGYGYFHYLIHIYTETFRM